MSDLPIRLLFLLRHLWVHGLDGGADLDRARLGCLRHFANHIDIKQAIVEAGAHHLHVVGKTQAPFESAPGDTAVQVAAAGLVLLVCLVRHQERIWSTVISSSASDGRAINAGRRIDQAG